MAGEKSGYSFPILNYDGSPSTTIVDLDDMMVRKELFLDAGLFSWGNGAQGALGNNNNVDTSSPVQIGTLNNWKQVSNGMTIEGVGAAMAVKTDGTLWGWGRNNNGQLGLGTTTNMSSPVQIGLLPYWKQVTVSTSHTAAIETDGSLWTWGNNANGQLGLGTTINISSPIQVGSLTNWKQVDVSRSADTNEGATHAIKTDGTLWAWGKNNAGGLGLSDTIDRSSPVQVGLLTNWKQVTHEEDTNVTALAIKTDGTLWAWGKNNVGQLGLGDTIDRSSPIQIGSLTNWKQVSGSAAVKNDGTLWVWGKNSGGTNISSPIQVGSLTNWKYVNSDGLNFNMAIKTDGTLWSWGAGSNGYLGTSSTGDTSSPVQIGQLTSWRQVSGSKAIQSPDLP